MTDIAVLGLGNFGTALARNWLEAGHEVRGWTVEEEVQTFRVLAAADDYYDRQFTRGNYFCVRLQSISTAPESRMGSLEGENSSRRLHRVELATMTVSTGEVGHVSIFMRGRHTGWSWNVVRRSWTDLEREKRVPFCDGFLRSSQ